MICNTLEDFLVEEHGFITLLLATTKLKELLAELLRYLSSLLQNQFLSANSLPVLNI